MKTNTLLAVSVVALGTLFAAPAHAGWSVNVSIGGPIHYPAPVVVTPPVCAPPVVACPPPPVVVCPPPRPVCPPVVYTPPCHVWGRYDYDRHDRDGWFHRDRDDRRRRGDHDRDDRDNRHDNGNHYGHR